MRFPVLAPLAAIFCSVAAADPGPTAVILANVSREDAYLSNALFKGMSAQPEVSLTYHEEGQASNRRAPELLSPWLSFGKKATFLLRAGEAAYLEAVKPAEGHASEIAILSEDGKNRTAVHYTIVSDGKALAGRVMPAGSKDGLELENPSFIFFDGFSKKSSELTMFRSLK